MMMTISTKNNKFLSLFVMAVVLIAVFVVPHTEAAGLRSRRSDEQGTNRSLKASKSSKAGAGAGAGAGTSFDIFSQPVPSFPLSPPILDITGTSVSAWSARCESESIELDTCVGNAGGSDTNKSVCKQCILGIAQLNTVNVSGLNSCSNPVVNGGHCRGCYQKVLDFYNCGAGANLGVLAPITATISSVSVDQELNSVTQQQLGLSSNIFIPGYLPDINCPLSQPLSGVSCMTQIKEYQFLECFYPNNMKCTCRHDDLVYNCVKIVRL